MKTPQFDRTKDGRILSHDWKCRYCNHTYTNPIPCVAVSHRCPKKRKQDTCLYPTQLNKETN